MTSGEPIVPPARDTAGEHALRRANARLDRWEALTAWMLSSPALLFMLVMLFSPVLAVLAISFTDWDFGAAGFSFVGKANYAELLNDPVFWKSLRNTIFYVVVVVPASVFGGLMLAMLIEAHSSLRSFYRVVHFIPVMITTAAAAVAWEALLHPTIGLVNQVAIAIGLDAHNWLQDPDLVMIVICVLGVWETAGYTMVLFLAGLSSIPRDLYDAAAVDGADGIWDRIVTVTWPMLGPVTLFVFIVTATRSFKVFDYVAVLTQGGPNKASEVLLHTIYSEGFLFLRTGYASALTVVFLMIILAFTVLQMKIFDRRAHYE